MLTLAALVWPALRAAWPRRAPRAP
jgi:hypothetical protein